MKDNAHAAQLILTSALALAAAWLLAQWLGLLAFALTGLALFVIARFVLSRIPGLTGDSYGAICELLELLVLILFTAGI